MGEIEGPTKNPSSVRAIKIPLFVVQTLKEYHAWWTSQQIAFGKGWQGKLQRLFIQENGSPINPDTINYWLEKFLRKHNFPHITPHSLRYTFATLNISNGVDIRTLQSLTGHAQASTLVNTYSHAIKSRQAAACDALEEVLTGNVAEEKHA
jgi:site-specific recombinase XerD